MTIATILLKLIFTIVALYPPIIIFIETKTRFGFQLASIFSSGIGILSGLMIAALWF